MSNTYNKSPFKFEDGVVVGSGVKYKTRNPIGRLLLSNFDKSIASFIREIGPSKVLEVGCGEGHITNIILQNSSAQIKALDISDSILQDAKNNVSSNRVSFKNQSIYTLANNCEKSEMVVCCEVLEHLEDPIQGLNNLHAVAAPYALLSVPREPIFRTMNFMRGAYISSWGNCPAHLQHWSKRGFLQLVSQNFEVLAVASPLPWTILLLRARQ